MALFVPEKSTTKSLGLKPSWRPTYPKPLEQFYPIPRDTHSLVAKRTGFRFEFPLMPTVAEQLRRAREAQNLTIYQVAEATKIKTDHIRALEDGNYRVFSAPVYIRGFVRTYASMLKLDVPTVMATLDAELSKTEEFREPPSLTGESRGVLDFWMLQLSKIQWRLLVPLVGLVAVIGISIWAWRAWHSHQTKDPLVNLGPGLYQTPTNTAGLSLPLPTNPPLNQPGHPR